MREYNIAIINVLTMDDEEMLNKHGKIIEGYFPNFKTTSICIKDQYTGVYNDETHEKAAKKVVELGKEISKDFDGIIVSCAGDPGVAELKKQVNIPVVGGGHSVSSYGMNFGCNIGVIGIRDYPSEAIRNSLGVNLKRYIKPDGITNANDLLLDYGKDSIIKAIKELEAEGVDAVVLACTGISTIGVDRYLNTVFDIPIIDPVYTEGLAMKSILDFKEIFK